MYIFEELLDLALPKGVSWPSEFHRTIAQNILLCNENINNMDKLKKGVTNILNIPNDVIKNIQYKDLQKYGFTISVGVDVNSL